MRGDRRVTESARVRARAEECRPPVTTGECTRRGRELPSSAGSPPIVASAEGAQARREIPLEELQEAPLIVTGLAAAVAFRARIWNIGAEGQFYMGALLATAQGSRGWR